MKYLKILLSVFTLVSMSFSMNAQSCHGSKAKKGSCCSKKAVKTDNTVGAVDAKTSTVLVENTDQGQKATFKIYGNCGMCENRIESALKTIEGVQSADWDVDTKMLTLSYDDKSISLDDIQQKIAAVGHDTDKYRAKDGVYAELPGCCQYDRAKI